MFPSDWVGLPYARLGRGPGFDCLGLFLALQRERHGRAIPDPLCTPLTAVRDGAIDTMRPLFRRVDRPREGDALLFHVRGAVLHVGYALDARDMLHVQTDPGSVIERWTAARWASRLEGVYRWDA